MAKKKYKCPASGCGASFDTELELLEHMEAEHAPPAAEKLAEQVEGLSKTVEELSKTVRSVQEGVKVMGEEVSKAIVSLDQRLVKLEGGAAEEKTEGETPEGEESPEEIEVGPAARAREATRAMAEEMRRGGAPEGWSDPSKLGPFLSGLGNLIAAARGPPQGGGFLEEFGRRALEEDIKTAGHIRRVVATQIARMFGVPERVEHE